ncbi:nicotinamidase/pyrazinamidase [Gramella sp. Hel_I_59]|uniref:bifunctional nicotinamidase/pyrazinamidase n=1 Tax=Gramella sp. Hel_I_59 TaxID=1249978 RepID=UPI0011512842|nr:bifunctional nicotinamidase/pyrazinamidase [Gramella sp. Hel_I_59]TQI69476.1 nicotinamidase/pyrazinamidase [Gramella sp. Hel_I_59]
MKTLVLIDIQNDFMPGGALAVENGDEIVPLVNDLQKKFDLVIATQDWHANGHSSFASAHQDAEVFDLMKLNGLDQVLWPDHCVQNTKGAEFHPELETNSIETIFRKGTDLAIDSYSGFYDNAHLKSTGLSGYLKDKGVQNVYFAGLAADYCVAYSVLDSIAEGFNTTLIEDATRAIDKEGFDKMKLEILRKGGIILNSAELEF